MHFLGHRLRHQDVLGITIIVNSVQHRADAIEFGDLAARSALGINHRESRQLELDQKIDSVDQWCIPSNSERVSVHAVTDTGGRDHKTIP